MDRLNRNSSLILHLMDSSDDDRAVPGDVSDHERAGIEPPATRDKDRHGGEAWGQEAIEPLDESRIAIFAAYMRELRAQSTGPRSEQYRWETLLDYWQQLLWYFPCDGILRTAAQEALRAAWISPPPSSNFNWRVPYEAIRRYGRDILSDRDIWGQLREALRKPASTGAAQFAEKSPATPPAELMRQARDAIGGGEAPPPIIEEDFIEDMLASLKIPDDEQLQKVHDPYRTCLGDAKADLQRMLRDEKVLWFIPKHVRRRLCTTRQTFGLRPEWRPKAAVQALPEQLRAGDSRWAVVEQHLPGACDLRSALLFYDLRTCCCDECEAADRKEGRPVDERRLGGGVAPRPLLRQWPDGGGDSPQRGRDPDIARRPRRSFWAARCTADVAGVCPRARAGGCD